MVLLNLATHRKKVDWLRKNPHATFLLVNPANAYHWLSIKCTVAREISEDDPRRGPAGHRPAGQDLDQVHRQRAALRPARPVDRRAPGAVRARRRPDRHLRAARDARMPGRGGGRRVARRADRGAGAGRRRLRRRRLRAFVGDAGGPRGGHRGARRDRALVRRALGRRPRRAVQLSTRLHPLPRRDGAVRARAGAPLPVLRLEHDLPRAARPSSPAERYLLGAGGHGVRAGRRRRGARAALAARTARADLVVCADGIASSTARAACCPRWRPRTPATSPGAAPCPRPS